MCGSEWGGAVNGERSERKGEKNKWNEIRKKNVLLFVWVSPFFVLSLFPPLGWSSCFLLLRRWLLNGCVLQRPRRSVGRSIVCRLGLGWAASWYSLCNWYYLLGCIHVHDLNKMFRLLAKWLLVAHVMSFAYVCSRQNTYACVCVCSRICCMHSKQQWTWQWVDRRKSFHSHGKLLNQVVIETRNI